ncbi:MAG: transglutaminase domain-containing protein [Prevotellaceae bacterium]|jgi:transglutaminase-like putative cysteine protease|nr:transglutaminase domain-containing protein [Prevotellaceae bacterium]
MKTSPAMLLVATLLFIAACGDHHFISDREFAQQVEADFEQKKLLMPYGYLFSIFNNETLTVDEREALMFLYAYMPLGDVTDYSGEFYLENVRQSFITMKEMPWGESVSEELFRYFVLPVRVNNEYLDNSRIIFYSELKDRVVGMSMTDALLEVNHWCHEKVTYTPSDSRTLSPLATVRNALGRCGEESVFLVAALRSVGIPARQIYTPRWAHTDSNHAWVEAWVDGKWVFLGACEPEPVVNLGWFNAPASRGMLMSARVFGRYTGPEEVIIETPNQTEINVTHNYASVTTTIVRIIDANGNPVTDADVEFKIYNYSEFYTIVSKKTDANGSTSLTTGKGDLLVWAAKDGIFGFGKPQEAHESSIEIPLKWDLDNMDKSLIPVNIDIIPPIENVNLPEVTEEQRAENNRRMEHEDSIRNAYVSSFPDSAILVGFAQGLNLDENRTRAIITNSRGNYQQVMEFLSNAIDNENALRLLEVVSTKDLCDTPAPVFIDALNSTPQKENLAEANQPYWDKYLLNPRVKNELLTPYKSYLQQNIPESLAVNIRQNPALWVAWCKENIAIHNDQNTQRIPMSPIGVWKAKVADRNSRDIFFVATLRSLGIPARLNEINGQPQYIENGSWIDADFTTGTEVNIPKGLLTLKYNELSWLPNPAYGSHFTISKIADGRLQLLSFPSGAEAWKQVFSRPITLDTGHYLLTTGSRMADGSVLSKLTFFDIDKEIATPVDLAMRQSTNKVQVIGSFDSESRYLSVGEIEEKSILQTTGRGYFVVAILGAGGEPTNHALKDISLLKDDFEKWGRKLVLLFPDESHYKRYRPEEFPNLPSTVQYGIDVEGRIEKALRKDLELGDHASRPIFIIGDTFNRVVFVSKGYTVGLGDQLMKVIHNL